MENGYHIVLCGWMMDELGLEGAELLVYAVIYGFSQDGETTYQGGEKYLSYASGLPIPTVRKALKRLMEKGLIVKLMDGYRVTMPIFE